MIRILGVMTGTSCDGIDGACVEVDAGVWKVRWSKSKSYPKKLRGRVLALQNPGTKVSLKELLSLERDLSAWFGNTLLQWIQKENPRPHVIANHGQTVAHFPNGKQGVTLQLGDPARISSITGLTVVSHFREGDIATGGEAAPLAPLFHQFLAKKVFSSIKGISFLNLGGIANITYLKDEKNIIAFDTGPANYYIDAATEKVSRGKETFDRNGRRAKAGEVHHMSLKKLLQHPFLKKRPPKSTGRDDFPISWFFENVKTKGDDLVTTATAFTAETVSQAYKKWILKAGYPVKKIFASGGGAKNPVLMQELAKRLPQIEISTVEKLKIPSESIEPQAFAYFAYLSLKGRPIGGAWTGVKKPGPPGWITPGTNWSNVIQDLRV